MSGSPAFPTQFAALVAATIATLTALVATPPSPTAPTLARSPSLTLGSVSAVVTPRAEVSWALGGLADVEWGLVVVGDEPPRLSDLSEHGRTLAQRLCAPCHGEDGHGSGALADVLVRRPRDLSGDLRSQRRDESLATGVFRTLTAGAERYGMPSFGHLSSEDRWSLAAWVVSLSPRPKPSLSLVSLPLPPESADLHLGQDVYRARCGACHGEEGRGVELALTDAGGEPCPPTVFAEGPGAFRTGSRPVDVAHTVLSGRPGTPMLPFDLEAGELWAVAAYVSKLAELGRARRVFEWQSYFNARSPLSSIAGAVIDDPVRRFKSRRSKRYAIAPDGAPDGCLGCHEGTDAIADGAMAEAISAVAGGDVNRECAVCHEGDPRARTKADAHAGLIGNPGSLWVTSVGAGCAKCHSAHGALTTLMGEALPEPVGGRLMHALSRLSDPSGATSGNYTYRLQRGLMAQETGKVLLVTSSVGLVSSVTYSDFPLADPDGPVPCVGNADYTSWIAGALELGYLERLEKTQGVPTFQEAIALVGGNKAQASIVDYARKACFRCHLWGEGKATRTEHRSAGCSACHVLYGPNGFSYGDDPTIPPRTAGHPEAHRIVASPPDSQCNHCHTRNPLTEGTEPHQLAGLGCVDCHTSIDVHGDGNAYPHMEHQVEVRCQDCHGEGATRPWDLPLGHDTPAAGTSPRGLYQSRDTQHLLSNRGNPRSNWLREGDRVVIESFLTGERHVVPAQRVRDEAAEEGCARSVSGHESVSCSLCHNRKGPRCGSCHMTYVSYERDRDWLLSAFFYDPNTSRQQDVSTPGKVRFKASDEAGVPFGAPDTRRDRANRWVPRESGCTLIADYMDINGKVERFVPRFNPGSESYPPPVANTLPHENASPPRSCAECHPSGTGKGKPVKLFGHVQKGRGDRWRYRGK